MHLFKQNVFVVQVEVLFSMYLCFKQKMPSIQKSFTHHQLLHIESISSISKHNLMYFLHSITLLPIIIFTFISIIFPVSILAPADELFSTKSQKPPISLTNMPKTTALIKYINKFYWLYNLEQCQFYHLIIVIYQKFLFVENIKIMRANLASPHNQPYQSQFTNHLTQNIHHSSEPLAKKRIGEYSYYPSHIIGSGYSSNVYKCKRRNDKSVTLAIKVIRLANMSKGNFELLQNQINILKQIDHPHIIKFHEVYNTKNNCYIITDYCEGGTLQNYLESHSNINWQEICQQVVDACRYLADKLIIHRDIKPANIFQKNGRWILGDFGFARFIPNRNSYIKEMYNVGSPLYMPPETLEKNIYSLKTDSFALGILLFHLITREFPWSGNSKRELLENYSKKSYPKEKIMHLEESVQKYLKGLCEIEIGRRMHIEQFYNLSLKLEKGFVEETQAQSCEQIIEKSLEISTDNLREKLNLNMAQKFKLCRFLSFIDINIQHFPEMCEISESIRRNIKYFLILFGWDLHSPQAKYMEEFKCKNYQEFSSMAELVKFQATIKEEISNLEDSSIQRCQVLKIKLAEYENILGNLIDGKLGKVGQEIDELILNPDFSRVSLKQSSQICEKMYTSHF